MPGTAPDHEISWIAVQELPPSEEEKRKDWRQFTAADIGFYALIVLLTFYLTYPSGILADPFFLSVYLAMLAGFGALFYWRHRRRARTLGRNRYTDRSRVGSTPTAFYIEDFSGRREVPWSSASTPELGTWHGRPFYVIPYRDRSGNPTELRLTAAHMAATLRLPNRPLWNLPEPFVRRLEADFRARGVPFPGGTASPPA